MALSARRKTAGIGLLVAGVAMLVLPGPGILTILAALSILNGGSEDDEPAVRQLPDTSSLGGWTQR